MTQPKPKSGGALNTLHHSLTQEEWRNALEAAKAQRTDGKPETERRDPRQPRYQTIRRCLLRVDRGASPPGLYVVRSLDVSSGGIKLVHGGPLRVDSVCCVIIETTTGQSLAAGGAIAWCKPIKQTTPPAYEMGIRFYEPIDASQFTGSSGRNEDAA